MNDATGAPAPRQYGRTVDDGHMATPRYCRSSRKFARVLPYLPNPMLQPTPEARFSLGANQGT